MALFLGLLCLGTVNTHACEDCDDNHIEVLNIYEDNIITPYATKCICGGTMVSTIINKDYIFTSKTACIHGYSGLDYTYSVETTTGLKCQNCGIVTNTVTTSSTYVSCNKTMP